MKKDFRKVLKSERNKTLMVVFPHPDDESFATGGLLQVARKMGWRTVVVCLTKGEAGQNFVKKKNGNLVELREKELKAAVKILGVDQLELWDFSDAKLRETKKQWSKQLKRLIEKLRPGVLISFDHSGVTGHPDHIVTSVEMLRIVKELGEKPQLFWFHPAPMLEGRFEKTGTFDLMTPSEYLLKMDLWTTFNKTRAILSHQSQFRFLKKLRIILMQLLAQEEHFYRVDLDKDYPYRFVEFKI